MPCAAGSKCAVVPDHTPGPPNFTTHRCRVCRVYLHIICGLADPLGDNEMQRVCHGCVNPNKRNGSSAGSAAGAASSKRPCPEGEGTGKDQQSGALGSLKRVGQSAGNKKARGAEKRERRDFEKQVAALDLCKTMTKKAAAKQLGMAESTLYKWAAKEPEILDSDDDDADSSAGDKSQAVDTPRPPPYTKVASQFGDLEGEADKCNMAEVSYHLRKAKLAWMREFGLRKRKQTIMADFL